MRNARLSLFERLMAAHDQWATNDAGCWLWTGARDAKGYGLIWHDGRSQRVHRVAYELATGRKLGRLTLDHKCRNPSCWRPSHVQPMTRTKNTAKGNRDNPRVPPQLRRRDEAVLNAAARIMADGRDPLEPVGMPFGDT